MTGHIFLDPQWIECNKVWCENQGRRKSYKNKRCSPLEAKLKFYKYWKRFIKIPFTVSFTGWLEDPAHLWKASTDRGTNSKWTQEETVDNSRARVAFAGRHTCRRAAALALHPSVHRLRAHTLQHELVQHLRVQGKVRLHFLIRQTCKTAAAISPCASLVQISEQWESHLSWSFRKNSLREEQYYRRTKPGAAVSMRLR